MFEKVLIANRGEIALRIHRACREMGIATVAIHSTADADAMHVRLADESVCVGPPPSAQSYLNIPAIVSACEISGADAVHPGYGFLSENAHFADILTEHGIVFIGPSAEHIRLMGDKIAARETVMGLGIPVVPGMTGALEDITAAGKKAAEIGWPVLVKAAAGGGGRGMKIAWSAGEFPTAVAAARAEAMAAFGNGALYMEKYLDRPRHIEIQVIADNHGTVAHLGERDCSLQRRHQKILEESPSPALSADERDRIGAVVIDAVKTLGYRGVGTMEFLHDGDSFHFIEMNTRLQVEHPVTEMLTGMDLVREQIRIAAGLELDLPRGGAVFSGHAMECRITAEDPETFAPSPGVVSSFHPPGGLGVRFDSALYADYRIPPHYDSLIGKLIVHARDRDECLMRLRSALSEIVIDGVNTTIPLFRALTENEDFIRGDYDIHWLERFLGLGGGS